MLVNGEAEKVGYSPVVGLSNPKVAGITASRQKNKSKSKDLDLFLESRTKKIH